MANEPRPGAASQKPPPLRKRVGDLLYNTYTFTEYPNFSREVPHSIHIKHFPMDELVPLHYGRTVEILYCEGIEGVVMVGNQSIALEHHPVVVFVPPFAVHSTNVKKSPGFMYVLKLSLDDLKCFLNIEGFLDLGGNKMEWFPTTIPDTTQFKQILLDMIQHDANLYARMRCILCVFELFESHISSEKQELLKASPLGNDKLRQVINWTGEHFAEHITIQDVASEMCMSKYYFCKYFKAATGATYWSYLNQVRMVHAASLVEQGKSTTECCYECGFESISYFIQLFKRTYGCTTLQYRQQYTEAVRESKMLTQASKVTRANGIQM